MDEIFYIWENRSTEELFEHFKRGGRTGIELYTCPACGKIEKNRVTDSFISIQWLKNKHGICGDCKEVFDRAPEVMHQVSTMIKLAVWELKNELTEGGVQ